MKKKIAIIGAGISGLVFGNLLKNSSKYEFTIFEKNSSLDLNEGYGVQLSSNSISILNDIGFIDLESKNKFNPKKIDFYKLKNNYKICDLDISRFNRENILYTTLKRSLLMQYLKDKLFTNSIQFNKKIIKLNHLNSKIEINFENNIKEIFDYLIVADGVFSNTKSIIFNKNIKPEYFGSLALRTLIDKKNLNFLNKENVSLFLGSKVHIVAYPINAKREMNLVVILRKKLINQEFDDKSFFNNNDNIIKIINETSIKENINFKELFNNINDFKCFPIFISDRTRECNYKNIFFLGDAFYAFPPTFAQGASQSIESAYELYNILNKDNKKFYKNYFINRTKKTKMIDRRSKLNYFMFHISNPALVVIRNIFLKFIVKNTIFLNKYLGKIYLKK